MKLGVSREKLGEAVAFVSRALPSRPVIPVLSGMLLDASAGGLTVSCFDYEVSARVRLDAEVTTPGTALVPGRLLAEITRSLPARPAEFSAEGDMVNLTCGGAEFGLVCLPAADYPALPQAPAAVGTVDGAALAAAVAQVAPAASRDDTLPMLTAICLDISGTALTLAATDRYRLATRQIEFTPARPGVRAVALVPARTMSETARAMAGQPVTIAFEPAGEGVRPAEGLISFTAGDRQVTARLIGGEFIKYENRFPAEFGYEALLPAGPVIDAVRRAALVAERAGPVRLSFSPGEVVIEAHAEGRARAAEKLPAEFAGDPTEIAFNPNFLLDGLTAALGEAGRTAGRAGHAAEAGEGGAEAGEGGAKAGEAGAAGGPADDVREEAAALDGAEAPEVAGVEASGTPGTADRSWIRLEFTSPAKPALVTWGGGREGEPDERDAAAFRYLLVPLRAPGRA